MSPDVGGSRTVTTTMGGFPTQGKEARDTIHPPLNLHMHEYPHK